MAVSAKYLNEKTPNDVLYIPSIAFEKSVIEAVSHYLKALKSLGIKGPWYVALGITNLKKSRLAVGASFAFGGSVFEGDEIMPPVVEIPAAADLGDPQNIARALRPAFDYIWREHNYPQSVNYSETGEWVGH